MATEPVTLLERLRDVVAFEAANPGSTYGDQEAVVWDALPAVVALIEAAQTAYEGFADDDALFYANQKKLAAALAAFVSTQESAA